MNQNYDINLSFHVDQQDIQNIKYLVVKSKRYPIDFDKLKKNSNYFYRNRKQFKQLNDINILDESDNDLIDISEEVIQAFISSCQNEPAQIRLPDVLPLQYLSYKYEFPKLISITERFIQEHSDKLVFHSILFKLNIRPNNETFSIPTDFSNTQNEEEIISDHLTDYIQNDQMISLPIPVLYRIFKKSISKDKEKFNEKSNEVIEFLFKCLDKYGKDASILFSFVDFEKQTIGVANRLIQNYSEKFDFNFINSTLLKTTVQLTSEVNKMKEEFSNLIFKMKQKQEEEFLKMKENEERREKIFQEEMEKMKDEEKKRESEFMRLKEDEQRRLKMLDEEIEKIKEEEKKKKKELEDEMRKIKEKEEEERIKKLQNEKVKEFINVKGKEFHGIMRFLTEQTGGNIHDNKTIEITSNFYYDNDPPKNLVDYTNDNYYNSGRPESEPKICFDFKDRSIQLSSYSIKSHENDPGDGYSTINSSGHLKNWVVEVSNDGKTWKTIDQHSNDPTLNGSNIVATFDINPKPIDFYRYIQLRTTGVSWYGKNRYDIFFYFIEFYGKMKEPKSK